MNKTALVVVIVLGVIVIGAVVWKKPVSVPTPSEQQAGSQTTSPAQQEATSGTSSVSGQFTGVDSHGNTVIGDGPIPKTITDGQIVQLSIKNYAYIDIATGAPLIGRQSENTEVIWTNNDSVPHTVTFDNGMADSGPIAPGKSFAFYFTKGGHTYTYHCSIHPMMKGVLNIG